MTSFCSDGPENSGNLLDGFTITYLVFLMLFTVDLALDLTWTILGFPKFINSLTVTGVYSLFYAPLPVNASSHSMHIMCFPPGVRQIFANFIF